MPNMDLIGSSDCYVLAKWIPAESSGDSTFCMGSFCMRECRLARAFLAACVRDMYAQHCGYVC